MSEWFFSLPGYQSGRTSSHPLRRRQLTESKHNITTNIEQKTKRVPLATTLSRSESTPAVESNETKQKTSQLNEDEISLTKPMHEPDGLPALITQIFLLWFGPVEDLQELGHSVSHPGMHVGLGALDVVVEVIPKQLDLSDGGRCGKGGKVSREED